MNDLQSPAPPDVLIADDDTALVGALCDFFAGRGYRCAAAGDGEQAVALARSAPPPCLLLDLSMPGLDGFAVARRLRADPRTRGIHIHCLTGRGDPATHAEAQRAGFELILHKPVEPSALLEAVRCSAWVGGLTKVEAEELLDWLALKGCSQLEVFGDGDLFAVRCVCPPGRRLARDPDGTPQLLPA